MPCPLCGGLIHPVAGRCKHCKQDLTALRATRPAAVQLPALQANGKNGHHGNGHAHAAAHAAAPIALASPAAITAIAPAAPHPVDLPAAVLPPRPTGRSMPAQASESPGWLRWPVIVMILAVLAIIGAVAVMLWPSHAAHADKRPPPPAPDRMSTDQLPVTPVPAPPPRAADPWDPGPPSAPHARAVPVPPSPDSPDDTDQLGTPGNMYGGLLSAPGADLAMQLVSHLCARFTQCGIQNDAVAMYCSSMKALQQQGGTPKPVTCDKARRCLDEVDQLSCTAKVDDAFAIEQLMMKMPDCMDALTGC